jgi:hypothetical protein
MANESPGKGRLLLGLGLVAGLVAAVRYASGGSLHGLDLRWSEVPALNPWGGTVYRMPDGRLAQVGKPMRMRHTHRPWGFYNAVPVRYFSSDGRTPVGSETWPLGRWNKLRLPVIAMEPG